MTQTTLMLISAVLAAGFAAAVFAVLWQREKNKPPPQNAAENRRVRNLTLEDAALIASRPAYGSVGLSVAEAIRAQKV